MAVRQRAWAITLGSVARKCRYSLERPNASDAGDEAGAELIILIFLLATERKGRTYPGGTFWGYMLLYAGRASSSSSTARARFLMGFRVTVSFQRSRAAQSVHAVLPPAPHNARARQIREACGIMSDATRGIPAAARMERVWCPRDNK